jgi:RNA polymerase sigma-70 factor, ECF subfamily
VLDEQLLLAHVAAGDEEALHQLYLAYCPRLRRYLWHQLDGDLSGIEEALQDIFLAVWRTAGGYRGDARVSTWVYQIAHYVALGARRRLARHPAHLRLATLEDDDPPESDWSVGTGEVGEDAVLNRLALADALGRLSAKHREVLALIFQYGFSPDEAAQILDVPAGTVKSRISYARKALLRALSTTPAEELRHDA